MTTLTSEVTRCPRCQTAFRITKTQLKAANGAVRCGSCLKVFNAMTAKHQNSPNDQKKAAPTRNPTSQPESQPPLPPAKKSKKNVETSTRKITADTLPLLDSKIELIAKDLENTRPTRIFNHKLWLQRAGWSSLTLALVTIIFLQYLVFNKNRLSLEPNYRSFYLTLCQYLNCSLPPFVDTAQIKSMELIIRKHSQKKGVLIMDAIIINESVHPQAFPLIELEFTDLNETPIAGRVIRPHEYLGGELTGTRDMPSNRPIRLGLEIIDPGQEAVNYSLTFLPNEIP